MARRVLKLFSFDVLSFVPDPIAVESVSALDSGQMPDMTPRREEHPSDLSHVLRGLLDDVCRTLGVPLALLSRDRAGWRFEAEAFPPRPVADVPRFKAPAAEWRSGPEADVTDQTRVSLDWASRGYPSRPRMAPDAAR